MRPEPSIAPLADSDVGPIATAGIVVERLDEVDSTNAYARRLVEQGRADGARFIVARIQTAGYGRHGRAWHSPPGGLWCTLLVPAPSGPSDSGLPGYADMGLRIGVACLQTIIDALARAGAGSDLLNRVRLKWPNDILIDDRKVCGSLCEVFSEPPASIPKSKIRRGGPQACSWLLIGVGINVDIDPASLASNLRRPAISLAAALGRPIDRALIETQLAGHLLSAVSRAQPWRAILKAAAARLAALDREISLSLPDGQAVRGVLQGLSDRGDPVLLVNGRRFIAPPGAETL